MNRFKSLAAASLAVLLLAACGSLDDIYSPGSSSNNYDIRGTVDHVDLSSRSIYLTNVSGYQRMLSSGGDAVRVYFDDQTTVSYQGKTYRPQDLEHGDQVSVRVDESGNTLNAESITVSYDASGGTSGNTTQSGMSTLRGTVRYIDTARRTIDLESASWISRFDTGTGTGNRFTIQYDANASIDVQGRSYPISNLERGDVIDVMVDNTSGSTLFANRIYLVRDVNAR